MNNIVFIVMLVNYQKRTFQYCLSLGMHYAFLLYGTRLLVIILVYILVNICYLLLFINGVNISVNTKTMFSL